MNIRKNRLRKMLRKLFPGLALGFSRGNTSRKLRGRAVGDPNKNKN